ncbi:hypothetical protein SUGI_0306760, partial [Cryptomeria japonica]
CPLEAIHGSYSDSVAELNMLRKLVLYLLTYILPSIHSQHHSASADFTMASGQMS